MLFTYSTHSCRHFYIVKFPCYVADSCKVTHDDITSESSSTLTNEDDEDKTAIAPYIVETSATLFANTTEGEDDSVKSPPPPPPPPPPAPASAPAPPEDDEDNDLALQRSQGAIPKRRRPASTIPVQTSGSPGAGPSGDFSSNAVDLSRRLLAILLDPENIEVHNLHQLKEELQQEMAST